MSKLRFSLKLTERTLDFLADIGAVIARGMLVLMIGLVVVDVIARYVFNSPLGFASEFVMYLLVGVTLLAANYVLREKGHIKVDVMVNLLPPKAQAWLLVVTDAASIFVVIIMLIQCIKITVKSFAFKTISITAMGTPLGIVQLMMPIGFGLLLIEFLRTMAISVKSAVYLNQKANDDSFDKLVSHEERTEVS